MSLFSQLAQLDPKMIKFFYLVCTHHVTPNKEFFSTYEAIDQGDVLMGNDAPCKIIGIGFIRIKMYDGGFRTLQRSVMYLT